MLTTALVLEFRERPHLLRSLMARVWGLYCELIRLRAQLQGLEGLVIHTHCHVLQSPLFYVLDRRNNLF